jgi:ABC-type spermidine/putrescine transport system permease subunit I
MGRLRGGGTVLDLFVSCLIVAAVFLTLLAIVAYPVAILVEEAQKIYEELRGNAKKKR